MTEVKFSEDGWRKAVTGGEERQGNHHPLDRESLRTKVNPNHEHVIGFIVERAFEPLSGLKMDRALKQGGDNLIDFRFDGYTIDVKGRALAWHEMPIKQHQLIKQATHFYVHAYVIPTERTVVFHGFMSGLEAANLELKPAFNSGMSANGIMNFCAMPEQSAERPLEELLDFIRLGVPLNV